MDLEVEIDNRTAELGAYAEWRAMLVNNGAPQSELDAWDAWGLSVRRRRDELIAQRAAPELPTVVITPVEDSTAYGVINIGAEEDA